MKQLGMLSAILYISWDPGDNNPIHQGRMTGQPVTKPEGRGISTSFASNPHLVIVR